MTENDAEVVSGREVALDGEPPRKVWAGRGKDGDLIVKFCNGDAETMIKISPEAAAALIHLLNDAGIQQQAVI